MFVCIVPNCSALIFSLFRRQRQENYRFTVHTGTYMYVPVPAFLFMGLSAQFALPACRLMCYSVYICTLCAAVSPLMLAFSITGSYCVQGAL